MATLDHPNSTMDGGAAAGRVWRTLRALPPNFFAIPFGIAGLAGVWRLAAGLDGLPTGIADALYLLAAVVYLPLLAAFAAGFIRAPRTVLTALEHPVVGPFNALPPSWGCCSRLACSPTPPRSRGRCSWSSSPRRPSWAAG